MSNDEQYRMLCEILSKLVDSDLTSDELSFLAHQCGVKISDFYGAPEEIQTVEVVTWKQAA